MTWIFYVLIILVILDKTVISKNSNRTRKTKPNIQLIRTKQKIYSSQTKNHTNYEGLYMRVPLLTQREQKQYENLRKIANEKNVLICPKVRLLDLITPVHGVKNYKALLSKVMSKHVDFVICNQDMHVLGIIELDDNSHLRKDRIERDEFVDSVLRSAGYKIKHTWEITTDILDSFLDDGSVVYTGIKIVSPTGWTWNENTKLWEPPSNLK